MSKNIPQLTEKLDRDPDDLFHIVRNGIDYKQKRSNMVSADVDTIYYGKLSISTASVLTLNGTPIALIASPGAGLAIELITVAVGVTYNSIAYATNTSVAVYTDTATEYQFLVSNVLNATTSRIWKGSAVGAVGAGITQIISDKGIYVKVDAGNPTAGNSAITIYYSYKIITV